jgi:hypothetical protein
MNECKTYRDVCVPIRKGPRTLPAKESAIYRFPLQKEKNVDSENMHY